MARQARRPPALGWRPATGETVRGAVAAALVLSLLTAACSTGGRRGAPRSSTATPSSRPAAAGAIGVAPAPSSCQALPVRRAPAPDRPRYALRVDVSPAERKVRGTLEVRFVPDLGTDRLVFRLWPNGPALSAAGAHLVTGPVTVDGSPRTSSFPDPTTLVVPVRPSLRPGQPVTTSMRWTLNLPGAIGDRIAANGDTVRLGSFFPILAWEDGAGWATDPPSTLRGETSTAPTADFALTVTAPKGLAVVASGVPDGHGHWRGTAIRDVAVAVGRFGLAHRTVGAPAPASVTVAVAVAPGVPDPAAVWLAEASRALPAYGARYGPYPWPAYTIVVSPELGGSGIEYPMLVMEGPRRRGGLVTDHETAHQWFYGLVGNDQARDPELDESLASYAQAALDGQLPWYRAHAIPPEAAGHLGESMRFWQRFPERSYVEGVYNQGPKALATIGTPAEVDCALRLYVARNAYRIARPSDLLSAFEAVLPGSATTLATFGLR